MERFHFTQSHLVLHLEPKLQKTFAPWVRLAPFTTIVHNESLEFKILNNCIDKVKAFQEKPIPLFGFQKNTAMKENNIFIPKSFLIFCQRKGKKEKAPQQRQFKVAFFCIPESFGENFASQNFNYLLHILSASKLNLFSYKKTFPTSKYR